MHVWRMGTRREGGLTDQQVEVWRPQVPHAEPVPQPPCTESRDCGGVLPDVCGMDRHLHLALPREGRGSEGTQRTVAVPLAARQDADAVHQVCTGEHGGVIRHRVLPQISKVRSEDTYLRA
jgi:hypothetical protein